MAEKTNMARASAAIGKFENVMRAFMDLGACDTETDVSWHKALRAAVRDGRIDVPERKGWQLFYATDDCRQADDALSVTAREACKILRELRDDVEVVAYVRDYCWRISWHRRMT